ncbi:MAG: peroxidase family protein [Hyphomicrobiaceae bacterium]
MNKPRCARGLALAVVLMMADVTGGFAQQFRADRKASDSETYLQSTRPSPLNSRWDRRDPFAASRPFDNTLRLATRVPFLVDTHGRKCMGFGRLFPLEGEKRRRNDFGLREQSVTNRDLSRLGRAMIEQSTEDFGADSEMPAGYTFLAQFIDHDITFDTTSMLNLPIRDDEFENARTVALDLDSVYGRGPEQDPYLYNLPYLRVGQWVGGCGANARFDLLRSHKNDAPGPHGGAARALIGDPRNDENFIIAQLHSAFIAFHNRLTDLLIEDRLNRSNDRGCAGSLTCDPRRFASTLSRAEKQEVFESAREHVIHYYHRIIMEDFLPRLIGERRMRDLLRKGRSIFFRNGFGGTGRNAGHPFIPVEFAVAAFRYGHSQVRERYQLRRGVRVSLLDSVRRSGGGSPAFQPVRPRHLVDWRYFFPISRERLRGFNLARRIDPEIAPFLHDLGRSRVVGRNDVISLPARNLMRGKTFRLPSGQAIATRILPVLFDRGLIAERSAYGSRDVQRRTAGWSAYVMRPDKRTSSIVRHGETPLWYYILQEAAVFGGPSDFGATETEIGTAPRRGGIRYASLARGVQPGRRFSDPRYRAYDARDNGGHTLGPVGAALVGEVLTGLVEHYRTKSGKGLSLRPLIRATLRTDTAAPLSLTPMPHVNRGFFGRYLMRNLLTDVGQASPLSTHNGGADACRYQNDNHYRSSGATLNLQNYGQGDRSGEYARRSAIRTEKHRTANHRVPHWAHKAFQND